MASSDTLEGPTTENGQASSPSSNNRPPRNPLSASIYKEFNLKSDDINNGDNTHNDNISSRQSQGGTGLLHVSTISSKQQGRKYSPEHAQKPGGVRLDDMIFGVKMAQLSVTDDSEDRLKTVGPTSRETLAAVLRKKPIHIDQDPMDVNHQTSTEQEETFAPLGKDGNADNHGTIISNKQDQCLLEEEEKEEQEEEAYKKPLSVLLREYFNLTMECWMDESGIKYGRPVDMQGFIASNITPSESTTDNNSLPLSPVPIVQDENSDIIVLSYRFTVNTLDWLANFDISSSKWDVATAERIGHAGICSCVDRPSRFNIPRVHTGFYNNFVYSIPKIRKHIIDPLMKEHQDSLENNNNNNVKVKPKKIYVCGASLGAALATLAFCYIIQELPLEDPNFPSHKIICVSVGSPRVGNRQFQTLMNERMKLLRQLDRAVNCRLVYHNDLVPHVPFHVSKWRHLDTLVHITFYGDVIINPLLTNSSHYQELVHLFRKTYWKGKPEPVAKQVARRFSRINSMVFRNAAAAQAAIQEKLHDIVEEGSELSMDGDGGVATNNGADDCAVDDKKKKESQQKDENATGRSERGGNDNNNRLQEKTDYELEWETCAGPIRDHMPYWYLICLEQLKVQLEMQQQGR